MPSIIARIYNTAFMVALVSIAILFAVRASAQEEMPLENEIIKIGYSGIKEELFQTYILIEGLKKMGYAVQDPISLEIADLYDEIDQNKIQISATFWEPLQNPFIKRLNNVKILGNFITEAESGYAIDKKTADKFEIKSLKDLQRPEIAILFDMNGDKKADILGCELGWGCSTVIKKHIAKLQLEDTTTYRPGAFHAQISEVIARYDDSKPILFYTWSPMWLTGVLVPNQDIVWLDAAPQDEEVKDFQDNTIKFIASKEFIEDHPDIQHFLETISLPINDVAAQNLEIRKGQDHPSQILRHTRRWIKANPEIFEQATQYEGED